MISEIPPKDQINDLRCFTDNVRQRCTQVVDATILEGWLGRMASPLAPSHRHAAHSPLAGLASRARARRSATLGTFGVAALGSSLAVKPALSLSEGPALSLSKGHKVEEVEGPLFRPPFHFGDALGWLVPSKPTERARRRRCARCLMSKQPQSQLSPALNL